MSIQQIQYLASAIGTLRGMCEEITADLFPAGEVVTIDGGNNYGVIVGNADVCGYVRVIFENGNTWPKAVERLDRVAWRSVPKAWKSRLARFRASILVSVAETAQQQEPTQ